MNCESLRRGLIVLVLLAGAGAAVVTGRQLAGASGKKAGAPVETDSGWPRLLGGFRGLAADCAWLRVQLAWERGDESAVERWSDLATTLDPAAVMFWINTARMVAYDFADARYASVVREQGAWDASRRAIDRAQAARALARLERARRVCADDPRLWIEMGNVHLHRRNDPAAAADCYARAADDDRAPLYARRIEAGLLWQLGRKEEALLKLRRHLQALHLAAAGQVDPELRDQVAARISAWARELEVSYR